MMWHCDEHMRSVRAICDKETKRQRDKQRGRQTNKQKDRKTDRQKAERQTERRTDTQTDRKTDRQTDRQTDRLTDWQTDRQTIIIIILSLISISPIPWRRTTTEYCPIYSATYPAEWMNIESNFLNMLPIIADVIQLSHGQDPGPIFSTCSWSTFSLFSLQLNHITVDASQLMNI